MLLSFVLVIVGLVLLVWSADCFVDGAVDIASYFGMSPLLIGMLIVGFGTSAPEMVVSAIAAFEGNGSLALGNAYGSNITNIALVLGVTAIIKPVEVRPQVVRREIPILFITMFLTVALFYNEYLERIDAVVLLAVLFGIMTWTFLEGKKEQKILSISTSGANEKEIESAGVADLVAIETEKNSLGKSFFWLVLGFVVLLASSRMLVIGAIDIATSLGVSDLVIGLTVVAFGTSLPELAASIAAVRKNEHDIAIGNVLGSNLFNLLAVVGIAGVISPMVIDPIVIYRDIAVMFFVTVLLFIQSIGLFGTAKRITRGNGILLIIIYLTYTAYLFYTILNKG